MVKALGSMGNNELLGTVETGSIASHTPMCSGPLPWDAAQDNEAPTQLSHSMPDHKDESDTLVLQVLNTMSTEGGTGASSGTIDDRCNAIAISAEDGALQAALAASFLDVKNNDMAQAQVHSDAMENDALQTAVEESNALRIVHSLPPFQDSAAPTTTAFAFATAGQGAGTKFRSTLAMLEPNQQDQAMRPGHRRRQAHGEDATNGMPFHRLHQFLRGVSTRHRCLCRYR